MLIKLAKTTFTKMINQPPVRSFLLRRLNSNITVLAYHGIAPKGSPFHSWTLVPFNQFDKQLEFLKENFDVISMADLSAMQVRKTHSGRPKAVITFDDGLKNNIVEALPLLEKHSLPATIYVSTGAVESGKLFWWDQLILGIQVKKQCWLDLRSWGLCEFDFRIGSSGSCIDDWEKVQRLLEAMKRLSPDDRVEALSYILPLINATDEKPASPFVPFSTQDVERLSRNSHITIGSHTHCHNILSQIPLSEAELSIERSLQLLGIWTGKPIRHFSFPNGTHVLKIEPILAEKGIETAVTCESGRWQPGNNRFKIPRISVGGYDSLDLFIAKMTGGLELLKQ